MSYLFQNNNHYYYLRCIHIFHAVKTVIQYPVQCSAFFYCVYHTLFDRSTMNQQIGKEERHRLCLTALSVSKKAGLTIKELNGKNFRVLSILLICSNLFLFADEFKSLAGQNIAQTRKLAEYEVGEMRNIVKYEGMYFTTSINSAHIGPSQN